MVKMASKRRNHLNNYIFIISMSKVLNKRILERFIEKPHLFGKLILGYDRLSEIHSEWIRMAWIENKGDVHIQAHRNSYKSTSVVIVGIILYLIFNPQATILLLRKTHKSAEEVVVAIKKQFVENEKLKAIYTEVLGIRDFHVKPDPRSVLELPTKSSITVEPSLSGRGITSKGRTGSHYSIAVVDDAITIEDRYSEPTRIGTINAIQELKNIVPSASGGRKIYVGTTFHPEDASMTVMPTPNKYPIGSIDIVGFDKDSEELKNMRKNDPSLYACNYELEHIKTSALFGDIKYTDEWIPDGCIGAIDPSWSGTHYTGFAMAYAEEGKVTAKIFAWIDSIEDCMGKIVSLANEFNCGTIYVENNGDKGASARELSELYPAVQEYRAEINKHVRIVKYVAANRHKIHIHNTGLESETAAIRILQNYEERITPDDSVDALAKLLEIFTNEENEARCYSALLEIPV